MGISVNEADFYKQSALSYAIELADIQIVKLLVESGANPNVFDINGVAPLHVAINRKNDQICDYLIEAGAFINVIDK
jgi:ankyrin repeat protein